MKKTTGFTIVELVVVIAVVGILATISIMSYSQTQRKARDTEREADISVIQSALETFYEKNGEYPGTTEMSDTTFLTSTLNLASSAIVAPGSTTSNNISSGTASSAVGTYGYIPQKYVSGAYSTCTNTADVCVRYTLSYNKETVSGRQDIQSKFGW